MLQEFLENNKITYHMLAKLLGVGPSTVYNWCHGKATPRARFVKKIRKITGIPLQHWGYYETKTGKIKKKNVRL